MKPTRYLIIISLTSIGHVSKAGDFSVDDNTYLKNIISHVRSCLTEPETILAGRTSIFAGMAPKTATEIFRGIATVLRSGDVIHVVEIGQNCTTTHQAFNSWLLNTGWLVAKDS